MKYKARRVLDYPSMLTAWYASQSPALTSGYEIKKLTQKATSMVVLSKTKNHFEFINTF